MSNQLQIGDQRAAILIIQQSQDNPQKALAELIENSIDANAKNVQIIRRKHGSDVELVIADDGEGVRPGTDGNPDFHQLACQICDSIKKKLSELERLHVQGEYGIGLLGFAAIGENLEILSKAGVSKTMRFFLKRGSIDYECGFSSDELEAAGTKLRIWPIHKEIQPRLTAEKINAYLGQALRDRIRVANVSIAVDDRLPSGKKLVVKPMEYRGEHIREIDKIMIPSGNVQFKLYITQEGESGRVSVLRRGTTIVDDISTLAEFERHPWSSGMVEGDIDDRFLTTPPATRRGIVPDQSYSEFVAAVSSIEKIVNEGIKSTEARREEKLGREIIKSLQEAFAGIMEDLSDEYDWFDVKRGEGFRGKGKRKGGGGGGRPSIRLSTGPMDSLSVSPPIARMVPGESKEFAAKAWTIDGALIPIGIEYKWRLSKGYHLGSVICTDNTANFSAGSEEGDAALEVVALQGSFRRTAEVQIFIYKKAPKTTQYPFPQPVGVDKPGEPWRSRFFEKTNKLEYNKGHRDFITAERRGYKAKLRYIAFLISKHLVIHNFKTYGEEAVLERMIEVISALESKLKT